MLLQLNCNTLHTNYQGDHVYLLHFSSPYKHAKHYLGYSRDLAERLLAHRNGTGANLMRVIFEHRLSFMVVRLWQGGRDLEHDLKRWHSGVRLCPLCNGKEISQGCVSLNSWLFPKPQTTTIQIEFRRGEEI